MAGMSAFSGRINRRQPRPWLWFLSGLIVGAIFGLAVARLLGSPAPVEPPVAAVAPRPTPVPMQTLRLTAQPPRGLLVTAGNPLKLEGSGASELAVQKARAIFVGLRNWNGTTRYLTGGQGVLLLRDADGVAVRGGWRADDYRRFVRGKPLQIKVKPNATYTLYFRLASSEEIDLGSFSVGQAPKQPVPTP